MTDVSVVIVTFQSRDVLPACLDSLRAQSRGASLETFVVDNASSDGSADLAEAAIPGATVIRSDRNLGFAAANNIAIARAAGRYVLLLNPDTVLDADSIERLVAFMDDHPDVGAAGAKLLNADGTLQHSIGRFPSVGNQLGHYLLLGRLAPMSPWLNEIERRPSFYETAHAVDWILGAALIVRREAIEAVGPLDERFFVFSEEVDWCLRLRDAGWPVFIAPEAVVTHLGRGVATGPEVYWLLTSSKLEFVRKHHGPAAAFGVRLIMIVGLAGRTLASWMRGGRGSEARGTMPARVFSTSLQRLVFPRQEA